MRPPRTLTPVRTPARTPRARRSSWLRAGSVLAASALLAFRSAPAPVGDPADLVPRGVGASPAATLEVRVAVKHDGRVDRLTDGRAYAAGDTLLFRVSAPEPVELTLRREQDLLWHGSVPAGESDLPVGYALEAGEGPARFVVEGGGASATISIPAVSP